MASPFPPEFFGNKPAGGGGGLSSSGGGRNVVEFRAGKMIIDGRLCKPDSRKGLICVKPVRESTRLPRSRRTRFLNVRRDSTL
jgi:hypothetical protein